jgi:hypothetical protein
MARVVPRFYASESLRFEPSSQEASLLESTDGRRSANASGSLKRSKSEPCSCGKRIADLTPEGERFIGHIKPAFHAFQIEAARASEIAEMTLRKSAGSFMLG